MESRRPPEVIMSKWNLDKIRAVKETNVFSIDVTSLPFIMYCFYYEMMILITDILLLLWQMFNL